MRLFLLNAAIILLCSLAFDSLGQERLPPLSTASRDNFALISSSPLIPLDSLVPPRLERKLVKMRICGSCGHNGPMPEFVFLIGRKSAPLTRELADKFPARSMESINLVKGPKARKYGAEAEKNGVVTFTVKKEFEDEILASLPEEFKKLHKL